jgi:hypothetical protein
MCLDVELLRLPRVESERRQVPLPRLHRPI